MRARALSLAATLVCGACSTPPSPPQTSLEIQAYQAKEFEASKQDAFEATLSILQDAGYIIESADVSSGFITGKAPTKSKVNFWLGPMNEGGRVTATVTSRPDSKSRVRLNFVAYSQHKSAWNMSQDVIDERPINDPALYQRVFAKIEETLFVQKATK